MESGKKLRLIEFKRGPLWKIDYMECPLWYLVKMTEDTLANQDLIASIATNVKEETENAVYVKPKREKHRRIFFKAICNMDALSASSRNRC